MEVFLVLAWVYAKCVVANKFTCAGYLFVFLAAGDLLHSAPGTSVLAWGFVILLLFWGYASSWEATSGM